MRVRTPSTGPASASVSSGNTQVVCGRLLDMEPGWSPTRHGGYRRTRVAQRKGDPAGNASEARAIASVDVKDAEDAGKAWPERLLNREKVGGSTPSPRTGNVATRYVKTLLGSG